MSSIPTTVASYAQGAFATGNNLLRSVQGDTRRVRFERQGQLLIQFDAVLQEGHAVETQPTAFPIENGGTVTDHIIVAPTELQLTAIITDTPVGQGGQSALGVPQDGRMQLVQESVISGAAATLGPLGTLGTTTALAAAKAQFGTVSPSFAAYEVLRTLAEGFPGGANPAPPTPFDVKTRLRTYRNMVIRSLQVPRDATTGSALVFNLTLTTLNLVQPQSASLTLSQVPQLSSVRQKLQEEPNEFVEQFDAGNRDVHASAKKLGF